MANEPYGCVQLPSSSTVDTSNDDDDSDIEPQVDLHHGHVGLHYMHSFILMMRKTMMDVIGPAKADGIRPKLFYAFIYVCFAIECQSPVR